ncbi:cytochrome c oxidase assembly protein COX16 homolog, mitochondrial-like [Amphiura filiformis]|uniref:cytochrome c oxidase assembly protein COX16 homolog, mitochondrial-like n=1 Tax=Amphiura filiformis TaxID=82378 RepID=UPI003B2189B7
MAAPMEHFRQLLKRNKFLRHFLSGGLPMLVLIVGGSFALKEFRTLRYQVLDKRKTVDDDVMDEINQVKLSKKISVEEEYERMKEENIDNWTNIRGPRPWENSKEFQDSQRANLATKQQSTER